MLVVLLIYSNIAVVFILFDVRQDDKILFRKAYCNTVNTVGCGLLPVLGSGLHLETLPARSKQICCSCCVADAQCSDGHVLI